MGMYSLSWDNPADYGILCQLAGEDADRQRAAEQRAAEKAVQCAADLAAAQSGDGHCPVLADPARASTTEPVLPWQTVSGCDVTRAGIVFALARRAGWLRPWLAELCIESGMSGRSIYHACHPQVRQEISDALERVEHGGRTLAEIKAADEAAKVAAKETAEAVAFRGADNRFAALAGLRRIA